jgi:hypothetical protein
MICSSPFQMYRRNKRKHSIPRLFSCSSGDHRTNLGLDGRTRGSPRLFDLERFCAYTVRCERGFSHPRHAQTAVACIRPGFLHISCNFILAGVSNTFGSVRRKENIARNYFSLRDLHGGERSLKGQAIDEVRACRHSYGSVEQPIREQRRQR